MTSEELFQQVKNIVESSMWAARRYGHEDEEVDSDDWDYEVDHYAQEIMGVVGV